MNTTGMPAMRVSRLILGIPSQLYLAVILDFNVKSRKVISHETGAHWLSHTVLAESN